MKKKVGTYRLGHQWVNLFFMDGSNGMFSMMPEGSMVAEICIGIDNEWGRILDVLCHETLELIMTKLDKRYANPSAYSDSRADYLFVFDHCCLSEIAAQQGYFFSDVMPDLAKTYKRLSKKRKTPIL